jgi:pilus assembly protein CpaB
MPREPEKGVVAMKFKTAATLMIAIVLGAVTAYVGVDVVQKAKKGAGVATKIVVAARDMEPGYIIESSDLKLEDVSTSLVPARAFKDPKLVAGRTVLASVVRGYPLIDNQLATPGSGAGVQAMVPKGMRAVAVEVSEGSAVAGLITPGCYVDVIGTFNNGDQQVATTVVQNVKVQFVQRARPTRSGGSSAANRDAAAAAATIGSPETLGAVKTVTLIVTPRQANRIELANNQGKPRLILRGGADDTDTTDDAMVKQNEMLGIPDPPPPATQPAPAPVVAVAPPPPPPPPAEAKVTDAFGDPPPLPPVSTKRPVQILRAGNESTIYFDEEGDRSLEEEQAGTATLIARRQQPTAAKQPPATRPVSAPQQQQQQPHQQQPPTKSQGTEKDAVEGGEPRTASGTSPGEPAPRTDVGQKDLRKGM